MEIKEKLQKIKSILDTKEVKVFNLLRRSEIKKMLKASETAIVRGNVHPWEIKPVLDRIEMLENLLVTKTGSDSIGSAEWGFWAQNGDRMGEPPLPFHFCPFIFYPNLKGVQF